MNAFANPAHERAAEELVRKELPDAYLTVSTRLLPTIRFYERVSTTVLNSYVGPKLNHYLYRLVTTLKEAGFGGVLLIMQSNGGVMSPQVAREKAALTLLSGPAGGPGAGLFYARALGHRPLHHDRHGRHQLRGVGRDRHPGHGDRRRNRASQDRAADAGHPHDRRRRRLDRLARRRRAAAHGPAKRRRRIRDRPATARAARCPRRPTPISCSAISTRTISPAARCSSTSAPARRAIETHIAKPMGLTVEAAAAGMYRVACNNMAQGVREVTIKRGYDPREFPLVAAGGAGPIHSCLICNELEIPLQIVPTSASVLCAFGMLLSELKHDFMRTFVARLDALDWQRPGGHARRDAQRRREQVLAEERIAGVAAPIRRAPRLPLCEAVPRGVRSMCRGRRSSGAIRPPSAAVFHAEHNRLYGYSLETEGTPIELINVRLQAVGATDKRDHAEETLSSQQRRPCAPRAGAGCTFLKRTPSNRCRLMTDIAFATATGSQARR